MRSILGLAVSLASVTAFAQPVQKDAFFNPGDRVIPQIATGGGTFFMSFQFMSLFGQAASVEVAFFDSNGLPMTVTYIQDDVEVTATTLTDTIAPGGIEFARTKLDGDQRIGYATVASTPPGSVVVGTAFNQVIPGRPIFQAFVPLSTSHHDRFSVPFLNRGPSTGSIAVVSRVEQDVHFAAKNNNGTVLCEDTQTFPEGQHVAFVIRERLPCTAGIDGVLEVTGTTPALSGFGITADDQGAFVTQPVYGPELIMLL